MCFSSDTCGFAFRSPPSLTFLQLDVQPPPDLLGEACGRRGGHCPLRRVDVSRRRLGSRDGRVGQRRVAVRLIHVHQRVRMLVVVLRAVPAHPLGGVVDAGGGAACQRVRAEAARGVGRVPLGVGQLLVVALHGRRHHVEHDDGRAHGLTEHVLGSGNKNTVALNTISCA